MRGGGWEGGREGGRDGWRVGGREGEREARPFLLWPRNKASTDLAHFESLMATARTDMHGSIYFINGYRDEAVLSPAVNGYRL